MSEASTTSPAAVPEVVVVGGGITGLAAAWFLRRDARVTVLEAEERLGGKIRTETLGGVPVEAGPDTFLAREPEAVDLCRQLGLGDALVAPANNKAWVWSRRKLRRLPEPHVLGVPLELRPVLRSGLVSGPGVARAALDLVLPRQRDGGDRSVADVIGNRLGTEVLDRLVEPLVGGINAGTATGLSLASTAPPLARAATTSRSLLLSLRRARRLATDATPPPGPLFLGLAGGMERLVAALRESLLAAGVELRTGTGVACVEATEPAAGAGRPRVRVVLQDGPPIDADAVVLTAPAFAAAELLAGSAPDTAAELADIETASVCVATLAYPVDAVRTYLDGAGFLVPRVDGRLVTACTWTTSKWPELRRGGHVLLRGSAGRAGDTRAMQLDDDALVARVADELREALTLAADPMSARVDRWPRAFPQYQPGHAARVARIEAALARELPAVHLAGASYRGIGIAACIRSAHTAANQVRNP